MELPEANRIIRSVKTVLAADGYKLPPALETDGLMILLGRIDGDKYLAVRLAKVRGRTKKADNKLLLTDRAALRRVETLCLFVRGLHLCGSPLPASAEALTGLNRSLIGELYEDGGALRRKEASLGGSSFTAPQYVAGSLKHLLASMKAAEGAPRQSKADFTVLLTHFVREMLILRPMSRCSAVTERLFFAGYAAGKGFMLHYGKIPPKALAQAEKHAFLTDDVQPLYKLLLSALTYAAARPARETKRQPLRVGRDNGTPAEEPALQTVRPCEERGQRGSEKSPTDDTEPSLLNAPYDVVKKAARLQKKIERLTEAYEALVAPYTRKTDKAGRRPTKKDDKQKIEL